MSAEFGYAAASGHPRTNAPTRPCGVVREGPQPTEVDRQRSPTFSVARTLTVSLHPASRASSPEHPSRSSCTRDPSHEPLPLPRCLLFTLRRQRHRSDQPGDVEPVGDLARALRARGLGDGAAPGRGGLLRPLQQVAEDLRGGPGLDQAAQAEADVPALVALDALHALAHAGQGAVGQLVEQRVLPGVEDDPLEQHVVEADALAEPRAPGGELRGHRRQPLLEELEHRRRDVGAGRRAPLGRRVARAARAPRRRCGRRACAWRCSSRRWRKKTQAIRLSWEASVGLPGRVGERRELLGDRVLGHAEAGEQRRQPVAALVRQLRPRAGVRRRGRWPSDSTAGGPRSGRRSWARSCASRARSARPRRAPRAAAHPWHPR